MTYPLLLTTFLSPTFASTLLPFSHKAALKKRELCDAIEFLIALSSTQIRKAKAIRLCTTLRYVFPSTSLLKYLFFTTSNSSFLPTFLVFESLKEKNIYKRTDARSKSIIRSFFCPLQKYNPNPQQRFGAGPGAGSPLASRHCSPGAPHFGGRHR